MTPNLELQAVIKGLVSEGMKTGAIAKATGYSERYIRRLRHQLDIVEPNPQAGRPSPHTEDQWKRAKAFLEDGASYRDTVATVHIPRTTMREHLPGYGWTASEGGVVGYYLVQRTSYDIKMALIRKDRTD